MVYLIRRGVVCKGRRGRYILFCRLDDSFIKMGYTVGINLVLI